jgi:hypothetical protein
LKILRSGNVFFICGDKDRMASGFGDLLFGPALASLAPRFQADDIRSTKPSPLAAPQLGRVLVPVFFRDGPLPKPVVVSVRGVRFGAHPKTLTKIEKRRIERE